MLTQNRVIDIIQSFVIRETDGKNAEMPLQPWVYSKAPRSGIHTRHVLSIVYVFQSQLGSVVPMIIVHVLPNDRMWLDCSIRVDFWHVHVVNEVYQSFVPWWSVVPTSFFL